MQSESPFGMGFFSVCFAAESVVVESRGKAIAFTADDLIAKRQISILPSIFIGGTRLTLQQCKLEEEKIESALHGFAKGFSVPVLWKGAELPRPHAQASLSGITTDVGFVYVPPVHSDARMEYCSSGSVYCQGLPIHAGSFSRGFIRCDASAPVIHIDHHRFSPRMPDRDCLINQEDVGKVLSTSVQRVWKDFLDAEKVKLPADVFAERYWDVARLAELGEVMNDVPFLPSRTLSYLDEMPILHADGESYWGQSSRGLSKELVQDGTFVLASDLDGWSGEGDVFAKLTLAKQSEILFVVGLPKGHWAHEYIVDLSETKAKISGKVIAKDYFNGYYVSGTVKVVDGLAVTMLGKTVKLEYPIALGSDEWGAERTFLVPKEVSSAGYVLRQASTYQNDSENYQETDFELDSDRFDNLVAILKGESGQDTLKKCLESAGARGKSNLRNNAYRVVFDADGTMTIEAL